MELTEKEKEELKSILEDHKNLIDASWIDGSDKIYEFKRIDNLIKKLGGS